MAENRCIPPPDTLRFGNFKNLLFFDGTPSAKGPLMKKHDTLIMYGLVVLSVLTSFLFISYGVNIIMSPMPARWLLTFAYVTTAYGMANIAVLSIAWSSRERWACEVNKLIALCYLGVFLVNTVKTGFNSGLEMVGILALALVLLANWFAVKKVVSRS